MQRVLGAERLWGLLDGTLWVVGTLWLMASESGCPGHVVASLIVLSKFFFFLKSTRAASVVHK